MYSEPLKLISADQWEAIQKTLLSDWPRSLPGINVLKTQVLWKEMGFKYGIQVYCLFEDPKNGFIAVSEKIQSYEVIIQYPKDDTKILEEALKKTKIIDWKKLRKLVFTAYHVIETVQKVIEDKNIAMERIPCNTFIIEPSSPLFTDTSLPPGYTFELLTSEHVELIDSKWPHRYPSSSWYFQLLIDTKSGYGLYKNGQLTSWSFVGECGFLVHLYTLEEYRNQGLAELVLKLISNELLTKKRQVFGFCVKGNEKGTKLFEKLGFEKSVEVAWCLFSEKTT